MSPLARRRRPPAKLYRHIGRWRDKKDGRERGDADDGSGSPVAPFQLRLWHSWRSLGGDGPPRGQVAGADLRLIKDGIMRE
jgi:hypothetical protein